MPYNRKTVGIVISTLRVQKGLTQEQLSGLAGIARSHLNSPKGFPVIPINKVLNKWCVSVKNIHN